MQASLFTPILRVRRRRSLLRSNDVKLAEAYANDDDDEGLIRRSPPLERQVVNLRPSPSPEYLPPPERTPTPERMSRSSNSRRRRRPRAQASQGDAVLIGFMGGLNHPDLATKAGEETLPQSDDSDVDVDEPMGNDDESPNEDSNKLVPIAKNAVDLVEGNDGQSEDHNGTSKHESTRPANLKIDTHTAPPGSKGTRQQGSGNQTHPHHHASKPALAGATNSTTNGSRSTRFPSRCVSSGKGDSDSVAISPLLRKHTIPSSDRPPTETLPAMQTSPPSSSSKSPNGQQKLPSLSQIQLEPLLQDARSPSEHLHGINRSPYPMSNGTINSPPIGSIAPRPTQYPSPRTRMMNGAFQQYPYGQPSPANSDASPRDSNMSPPEKPLPQSFYSNGRTPRSEELTPQSAHSQESGSSFSTAPSPHHSDRPILPPLAGLPNGPMTGMLIGSFRCDHAGCTAPPFQTQYLLK